MKWTPFTLFSLLLKCCISDFTPNSSQVHIVVWGGLTLSSQSGWQRHERWWRDLFLRLPVSPWFPVQNIWSGLLPRLMTADELAAIGFGAYMLEPTVPPFLPSLKVLTYGGHFVLTPGLCYPPAISKSLHSFWNIQEILISQNAQQTIHLLP